MVNMNKFEEPSVYALVAPGGGLFYVGRTMKNAQNRLWEHIYRARSDHPAPVYQRMREVGYQDVTYQVLHFLQEGEDAREIEAAWIKSLLDSGHDLVNAFGRDGRPDSWSPERIERGMPTRRGKPTWIKGKRGEEAGWTEERRRAQSERRRAGKQ